MPIKKSTLEKKWYFRVAKVFLLIIPFLLAISLLIRKINIFSIPQKDIPSALQNNITYIVYVIAGLILYFLVLRLVWKIILYIAFGGLEDDTKKMDNGSAQPSVERKPNQAQIIPIVLIIVIIMIFAFAQAGYIKLPKINTITDHTYGTSCTNSKGETGLYGTNGNCYTCSGNGVAATSPTNNNCSNGISGIYCCTTGKGNDGCIATGCGSMWYCSGSYYIGNQEINIPGLCFPVHPNTIYSGWTGVCRQCP
jgi:hypothetical protein